MPSNAFTATEQEQMLDVLRCHLVALNWIDALKAPQGESNSFAAYHPQAFAVSAFILSIGGHWLLITAGHIIHQLEQRLKQGRRIVKAHLLDIGSANDRFPMIPLELDLSRFAFVDDDESALDYAIMPLSPMYRELLIAGGVRPLSESTWLDPPQDVDAYMMLGFPKQAKTIDVRGMHGGAKVSLDLKTPLLPITRVRNPPDSLRKRSERFYASVPIGIGRLNGDEIELSDIDGMSGGPILAIRRDGKNGFRYWILALQSSWDKKQRVLAGCFIQPFAAHVSRLMLQHPN